MDCGTLREVRLNGERTAMVHGKSRDIAEADLIVKAATCGVSESKIRTMSV